MKASIKTNQKYKLCSLFYCKLCKLTPFQIGIIWRLDGHAEATFRSLYIVLMRFSVMMMLLRVLSWLYDNNNCSLGKLMIEFSCLMMHVDFVVRVCVPYLRYVDCRQHRIVGSIEMLGTALMLQACTHRVYCGLTYSVYVCEFDYCEQKIIWH